MARTRRPVAPTVALAVFATLAAATTAPADIVGGSTLIGAAEETQLTAWLGQGPLTLTNIFSKTRGDGQDASAFHAAVDGAGPTFSIIRIMATEGNAEQTIGGYNPQSWASAGGYHVTTPDAERTAFVFNLTSSVLQRQMLGAPIGAYQTFNDGQYGPTFGGGHDLYVKSLLERGDVYRMSYGTGGNNILGVSSRRNFDIAAMEVFQVIPAPGAALLGIVGLTLVRSLKRRLN